jgi:hypothetical protein
MAKWNLETSPILVVVNSQGSNPFASYLLEILDSEGFFARNVHDLCMGELSTSALAAYHVVLVTAIELSPGQQDALRGYVDGGGRLVALRPPLEMSDMFGIEPSSSFVNRQVKDRYLVLNTDHDLIGHVPSRYLQFQGTMDLYRSAGGEILAYVAGDLDMPSEFAAISVSTYGAGRAAMFAYDLATSIVSQHQGRQENASTGTNADADGDDRWSPNDHFVDQLDARLKRVPQADVHQDLLVRLLTWLAKAVSPLPRAWYFPNAAPCIAWFNGDSDGMDREDYDAIVSTMERHGGVFTAYLLDEHHALFSEQDVSQLRDRGHAFGQHTDLALQVSIEDARADIARSLGGFRERFGFDSLTHRGHCLVWPGWTEMAGILADNGVRIDQSFIPRRFLKDGYLNGSGRPARFIHENGVLVDLYEQNTLLTDDGSVEPDKFLVPNGTPEEVVENALGMLDDAMRHYHGVFQVAFHPHLTRKSAMWLLEALVGRCQELGVPMVSGDAWVEFHAARRRVQFDDYSADPEMGLVRFRVSSEIDIRGLTIMLPICFATNSLETIRIRQSVTPVTVFQTNGIGYGWVAIDLIGEEIIVEGVYSNRSDDVVAVAVKDHRLPLVHSPRG